MRSSGGQALLQGLRRKGRGDVYLGNRGIHAGHPEFDTLSDVLVRQLRAHTGSREIPGPAGVAIYTGRGRSGLPPAGNGHFELFSRQRQILGYGPRDLHSKSFVGSLRTRNM